MVAYAGDDPVNEVDPSGDSFFGAIGNALSVAAGVAAIVSLAFVPEITIPIGLVTVIGAEVEITYGTYGLIGGP